MILRSVQLINQARTVLAKAKVADEGDHYGGTIDLRMTPVELRALFKEFEEIVNGQMRFLDAIQEEIEALSIKAVFDDGAEVSVKDLQVFPSTGDISFRHVGIPSRTT